MAEQPVGGATGTQAFHVVQQRDAAARMDLKELTRYIKAENEVKDAERAVQYLENSLKKVQPDSQWYKQYKASLAKAGERLKAARENRDKTKKEIEHGSENQALSQKDEKGGSTVSLKQIDDNKSSASLEQGNMDSATQPREMQDLTDKSNAISSSVFPDSVKEPRKETMNALSLLASVTENERVSIRRTDNSEQSSHRSVDDEEDSDNDLGDYRRFSSRPVRQLNPLQKEVMRFLEIYREDVKRIFIEQHKKRRCPENNLEVLPFERAPRGNCVIPADIKDQYNLPPGIQGTQLRGGRPNFNVLFHNIMLSGKKIGLSGKYVNFEDPRDCAEVIAALKEKFEHYLGEEDRKRKEAKRMKMSVAS